MFEFIPPIRIKTWIPLSGAIRFPTITTTPTFNYDRKLNGGGWPSDCVEKELSPPNCASPHHQSGVGDIDFSTAPNALTFCALREMQHSTLTGNREENELLASGKTYWVWVALLSTVDLVCIIRHLFRTRNGFTSLKPTRHSTSTANLGRKPVLATIWGLLARKYSSRYRKSITDSSPPSSNALSFYLLKTKPNIQLR